MDGHGRKYSAEATVLGKYARSPRGGRRKLAVVVEDDNLSRRSQGTSSPAPSQAGSTRSRHLDPLVRKIFTGVERFKSEVGGTAKMIVFLEEYAREWKSGKLFGGKARPRAEAPWQQGRRHRTAYERSQTTYAQYKETIGFLVEAYMKDKKKFVRFHTREDRQSDGTDEQSRPSKKRKHRDRLNLSLSAAAQRPPSGGGPQGSSFDTTDGPSGIGLEQLSSRRAQKKEGVKSDNYVDAPD